MALRALFDTNLFINFLLSPDPSGSAVGTLLTEATAGRFELVLVPEAASELRDVVRRRPYLAAWIDPDDVEGLLERLRSISTTVPALRGEIPAVSRDRKDDYLIAQALASGVDAIVSRDYDLLDLVAVDGVRILHPATLLDMLRAHAESEGAG